MGTLSLAVGLDDDIEHHRLLFLVGLAVPVICIIKRNIQYHRDIETSGV